jgi:hypothetical protein
MKKAGYIFHNCHIDKSNIKDSVCFTWNSPYGHRDQIATHIHYTKKEYNDKISKEIEDTKWSAYEIIGVSFLVLLFMFLILGLFGVYDND